MSSGSEVIARHVSPDGELTLVIERVDEPDGPTIIMGFEEGDGWHFHPTEDEALSILSAVLTDQVVIMSSSYDGQNRIELMGDLEREVGSGGDGVRHSFRLWSRRVSFEDLADGEIAYTPLDALWNWRAP